MEKQNEAGCPVQVGETFARIRPAKRGGREAVGVLASACGEEQAIGVGVAGAGEGLAAERGIGCTV